VATVYHVNEQTNSILCLINIITYLITLVILNFLSTYFKEYYIMTKTMVTVTITPQATRN